ncbi:uncharacterized protein LOC120178942 [Hibiscus syriacus]|uniref:uncharacterized protein LOC120178942 n=1 Tax=Hibiscus syriacus TaxID=106335 RepID=UPI00192338F7|nr:uncharacterized protein LOC120178942 [Hibiscus syriacus]
MFRQKVDLWNDDGVSFGTTQSDGEMHFPRLSKHGKGIKRGLSGVQNGGNTIVGEFAGLGIRNSNISANGPEALSVDNELTGSEASKFFPSGPGYTINKFGKLVKNRGIIEASSVKNKNKGTSCISASSASVDIEVPDPNFSLIAPNSNCLKSQLRNKAMVVHRSSLSTKSEPLQRRRMASYSKVYRRERKHWHGEIHKEINGTEVVPVQNKVCDQVCTPIQKISTAAELNSPDREETNLVEKAGISSLDGEPEGCVTDSHLINSKSGFCKRRVRRSLVREALEHVNIFTASSTEFSELLDEAVATWGLGKREKQKAVQRLVSSSYPSFLWLQETKVEKVQRSFLRRNGLNNLQSVIESPAIGSSGGLLCCWDDNVFEMENHCINRRFIAVVGKFRLHQFRSVLINVYGPSVEEEKESFFEELSVFISGQNLPVCVGGDFNVYLCEDEKVGKAQNRFSMRIFSHFIQSLGLINLPLNGGRFTWCNNQDDPTFVRLDRFLVDGQFLATFPEISQSLIPKSISDHNAILLKDEDIDWGKRPFRLFNYLMEEDGFEDMVKHSITDCKKTGRKGGILSILKNSKAAIKKWSGKKNQFPGVAISDLEKKIQKLEEDAQQLNNSSVQGIAKELSVCRAELWRLHRIEKQIWLQNSRKKWLNDGDRNIRFFHTCASVRRKRNALNALIVDGNTTHDPTVIKAKVKDHFFKIYNDRSTLEVEDIGLVFPRISFEQNMLLEKEFSEEEFFHRFFVGKEWEHVINHIFITLIPKESNIGSLDDYRPISLVGGVYKILSKCLSRRLRSCIGDLISPTQFAFIPGRQILDCSLIANEGIDYWRKKGLKGCVFKVDFKKAYDTVDWPILFKVMEKMGFGFTWISWIRRCVSTASISVLVNGVPSEEFPMAKGLRQGCSLSPLLFNLVGELLNLLIRRAVSEGLFAGLTVGKEEGSFNLSHLQFADDLIIFCGASKTQIMNLKRVLRVFEVMSGLQLNLKKSRLFGINISQQEVKTWADSIGCLVGNFPSNFLGLPLGATRNSSVIWEPVVQNFHSKLAGWKAATLSLAGRLVLIKSVLSSLPTYFFVYIKIPASILKTLNSIMSNFLWGGAMGNGLGGLQMREILFGGILFVANTTLTLLDYCLTARFLLNPPGCGDQWLITISNKTHLVVSSVVCASFMSEMILFPRLFSLSTNKFGKLCEFGEFLSSGWIWDVKVRRNLNDWELEQWCNLVSIISSFSLSIDSSDGLIWKGSGDGVYTVGSCVKSCVSISEESHLWNKIVWRGLLNPNWLKEEFKVLRMAYALFVKWLKNLLRIYSSPVRLREAKNFLLAWDELKSNSVIWTFIPGAVIWTIWKFRNYIVFEGGKLDQTELFFLTRVRLASWYLAKKKDVSIPKDSLISDPSIGDSYSSYNFLKSSITPWLPPPTGFIKLNVDAAISCDWEKSGLGGLMRDHSGAILGSFQEPNGFGPPTLKELKAIQRGISFFTSVLGRVKDRLIIESDSRVAVDWINKVVSCPAVYGFIVRDIVECLKTVGGVVRWIARTTNMDADALAKAGIG